MPGGKKYIGKGQGLKNQQQKTKYYPTKKSLSLALLVTTIKIEYTTDRVTLVFIIKKDQLNKHLNKLHKLTIWSYGRMNASSLSLS